MYFLYLFITFYSIYNIYRFFRNQINNYFYPIIKFEDNVIIINSVNYYEIIEENNRLLFENEDEAKEYIKDNKNIKLICLSYKTNKKESEKILFNNVNDFLNFKLSYDKILIKPLYIQIEKVYLEDEKIEQDITEFFLEFSGPEYNFHNMPNIFYKDIIDYFDLKLGKKIKIIDNFKREYNFNNDDKLIWNSNII